MVARDKPAVLGGVHSGGAARARRCRRAADGAFPAPADLRKLDPDLPGRKVEFLHAVAEAALDGELDGARLRAADPAESVQRVRSIKGVGPFAAELIVLRGANVPDGLPHHERRLEQEVNHRYDGAGLEKVAENWRPFRTWASVHLRVLREQRLA